VGECVRLRGEDCIVCGSNTKGSVVVIVIVIFCRLDVFV
jgi:hypothetical protein